MVRDRYALNKDSVRISEIVFVLTWTASKPSRATLLLWNYVRPASTYCDTNIARKRPCYSMLFDFRTSPYYCFFLNSKCPDCTHLQTFSSIGCLEQYTQDRKQKQRCTDNILAGVWTLVARTNTPLASLHPNIYREVAPLPSDLSCSPSL